MPERDQRLLRSVRGLIKEREQRFVRAHLKEIIGENTRWFHVESEQPGSQCQSLNPCIKPYCLDFANMWAVNNLSQSGLNVLTLSTERILTNTAHLHVHSFSWGEGQSFPQILVGRCCKRMSLGKGSPELKSRNLMTKKKGKPPDELCGTQQGHRGRWLLGVVSGAQVWHELAHKKYLSNGNRQEIITSHTLHANFQENI